MLRLRERKMTSLKECVKEHARSFIWSADDEHYGDWVREDGKIDEWAEGYIKELEEHMNAKANQWNGKILEGWIISTHEVLRFLRGETK
jgi:hypothetical protein